HDALSPSIVLMNVQLSNLFEEFLDRGADFLELSRVPDGDVGITDLPAGGRDLMLDDEVLHGGVADARPAFTVAEDHVEVIGNDRGEVVDVRVPIPVIGCG